MSIPPRKKLFLLKEKQNFIIPSLFFLLSSLLFLPFLLRKKSKIAKISDLKGHRAKLNKS